MSHVPREWTRQLAALIAAALREFLPRVHGTPVAMFTVGCFPWHGCVELSILTVDEVIAQPALIDQAESAAWRFYNFDVDLAAWRPAEDLGRQMAKAYSNPDDDRPAIVDEFLRACASAVASPDVSAAVELLTRGPQFRISVAHPDDGREFYSH